MDPHESIEDQFKSLPIAISPPHFTNSPNERIDFYSGQMVLKTNGKKQILQDGILSLHWLPRPRIRFTGIPEGGFPSLTIGEQEEVLQIDELAAEAVVIVTQTKYGPQGSELSGILNEPMEIGNATGSLDHIDFALTNFHSYFGQPIRPRDSNLMSTWAGRLECRTDEWLLTVDQVQNWKDLEKQLKDEGGFAVSHGARLEHIDNSSFSVKEGIHILNALHFFLAFVRGYWCGPILELGFQRDNQVWQRISPWKLSPWKYVRTWFPQMKQVDATPLGQILTRFLKLWSDDEWETPLRHYIWWYVESISIAESHESAIVMNQIALELLGWVILVEEKGIISKKGFTDLQASDKIRLLLSHSGIPREIPPYLGALHSAAKALSEDDGPGIFCQLRNAIIHPSKEKRNRLNQLERGIMLEAAKLGHWYIEMVLLALLGYEGPHCNRTNRGTEEPVPWN